MRLVVDSNILFAALIRDSVVRHLFLHIEAELFLLKVNFEEIDEHKKELIRKSRCGEESFSILFESLSSKCRILEDDIILGKMGEAEKVMDRVDPDDTPFIAAALAIDADIWSDDSHFKKQKAVTVLTTKELIERREL